MIKRRILSAVLSFVFALTLLLSSISAFSVQSFAYYDSAESGAESLENMEQAGNVVLTPGKDDTQMNFCVVSSLSDGKVSLKISKKSDMSDSRDLTVKSKPTILFNVSSKAVADGLEPDTTYYYSCYCGGVWSEPESFRTSGTEFRAAFVSNPQLGRSDDNSDEALLHDTLCWHDTLDSIYDYGDVDCILCAGDQVNMSLSQNQYNLLLSSDVLRKIPFAPTIGNHDFYSVLHEDNFNVPNEYRKQLFAFPAGKDYYFRKGCALFIVLDSNVQIASIHEAFIRNTIEKNSDATWQIVMLHHSAYDSVGDNCDFVSKRLAPVFESCGIDLVLSGHEHRYARTYPMLDGKISTDSSGIVYIEGGCASMCNGKGTGASSKQDYVAGSVDSKEAVYVILDFRLEEIYVKTYLTSSGNDTLIDEASVTGFEPTNERTLLSNDTFRNIYNIICSILP